MRGGNRGVKAPYRLALAVRRPRLALPPPVPPLVDEPRTAGCMWRGESGDQEGGAGRGTPALLPVALPRRDPPAPCCSSWAL